MADAVGIQYSLRDDTGKLESVEYFVDTSIPYADIQTEATAFAQLLDLVTGAAIAGASVRYPLTLPGGIKSIATPSYKNTRGALLAFDVGNTKYRWSNRIPAVLETFINGGDISFDATDAMDDLIQHILNNPNVTYVNRFSESLLAFIGASLSLYRKPR
jgi:hypothetical protein